MTYADRYFNELEQLRNRNAQASYNKNVGISPETRDKYLHEEMLDMEKIGAKYGITETVLETKGILKNIRYDFSDGSSKEIKWF